MDFTLNLAKRHTHTQTTLKTRMLNNRVWVLILVNLSKMYLMCVTNVAILHRKLGFKIQMFFNNGERETNKGHEKRNEQQYLLFTIALELKHKKN